MKIISIGNVAYDVTIPMDHFPVENTKYRLYEKVECGGGQASNMAYLLAKWGMDVAFVGVVGDDCYGAQIKKEFDEIKVNTKYLELSDRHYTTMSMIIASQESGSRTILSCRNKDILMTPVEINDIKPDMILLDGQEPVMANALLDKNPDAIVIIDAGRVSANVTQLAKRSNHVVTSKEYAEGVTGVKIDYDNPKTIVGLYKKMEETFPESVIVITLESKGCLYKHEGKIQIMPSIKVKTVDSTAAGDIFHGAYAYGIANNLPFLEVLRLANITAATSVTKLGGRLSIPTLEEIEAVYNEYNETQ